MNDNLQNLLGDYITSLEQEIERQSKLIDELEKRVNKLMKNKNQEEYTLTKDENGTAQINGEWYRVDKK